jgi:hypothetical protein
VALADAVQKLEQGEPGRQLALAYSCLSQAAMLADEGDDAIFWGAKAIALGERVGDVEAIAHGLNNIGAVEALRDLPEGLEKLERSLALAEEAGLVGDVARAYVNLSGATGRRQEWALADAYISRGVDYCRDHGMEAYLGSMLAARAESELA